MDESALINCKTCDGKVSKNASGCPHCGEPNPAAEIESDSANIQPPPKFIPRRIKNVRKIENAEYGISVIGKIGVGFILVHLLLAMAFAALEILYGNSGMWGVGSAIYGWLTLTPGVILFILGTPTKSTIALLSSCFLLATLPVIGLATEGFFIQEWMWHEGHNVLLAVYGFFINNILYLIPLYLCFAFSLAKCQAHGFAALAWIAAGLAFLYIISLTVWSAWGFPYEYHPYFFICWMVNRILGVIAVTPFLFLRLPKKT